MFPFQLKTRLLHCLMNTDLLPLILVPNSLIYRQCYISNFMTTLWLQPISETKLVLQPFLTLQVLASSGWLKAIPQSSLGLAIHGPEFVVGLRLWLGIPLFPSPSSLCMPCPNWLLWRSSSRVFSWSHENLSPWCFGWHQCPSCFIPKSPRCVEGTESFLWGQISLAQVMCTTQIFSVGRPAFFDLSVCSTTQPTFISSASTYAGPGLLLLLESWPKMSGIKML